MATVKRSVAFDPDVWKEGEAAARTDGTSLSALVNVALSEHLAIRRGLLAMDDWQTEHGAFSDQELAAADDVLDRALQARR